MLTWLADFSHLFSPLNLFRYLTFRTIGAAGTGLFLVFFFGPRSSPRCASSRARASRSAPTGRNRIS